MTQSRRLLTSLGLTAFGLFWLGANQPVEGPVLVSVTRTNGFTTADLLSVACFLAAGWLVWKR